MLHASYLSPGRDPCDAENTVVYNIGAPCFRQPARNGIRFERGFGTGPPLPDGLPSATHYYRYEPADASATFRYWRRADRFARVESAGCGPLSEFTKVAAVWHATKTAATIRLDVPRIVLDTLFALSATVHCADDARPNPAAIIKPLFDGIIAALHFHDHPIVDDIAERIGHSVGVDPDDVAALLSDPSEAVLGGRRLAWCWRQGVQWNPADDRCLAGDLIVLPPSLDAPPWSFAASLFSIEPAQA
jgi:hypothetical protein